MPLKIETDDLEGVSTCYNNLGNIYADVNDYTKALENYKKSLEIDRQLGDSIGVSICLTNIGMIYEYTEDYDLALDYYNRGLEIMQKFDDLSGICENYKNIGTIYIKNNEINKGLKFLDKSWNIALDIEDYKLQQSISSLLSSVYAQNKNFQKAYEFQVIFKNLSDTVFNSNNLIEITKMETSFEYERLLEIKELEKKQQEELAKADLKRRKIVTNSAIGGFILMLLLAFLSYRSFKIKKKAHKVEMQQKEEIKQKNEELKQFNEELNTTLEVVSMQKEEIIKQHEIVTEQKEEITKSIIYASRIQNAILPPKKNMQKAFSDYFVFYNPRSIVSGDFYWAESTKDKVFWAAADCTGHGVPGAFMSMLGISLLNEIIKTNTKISAAEVLDSLRNQIKTSLRQTGKFDEQKDGMDIALCMYEKKTKTLNFAGAYNPLYIIRETDLLTEENSEYLDIKQEKYSLLEITADKQPVAVYIKESKFTDKFVKTETTDTLYTFSDGYPDQFGGENKSKFMLPSFKKLLLEINELSMNDKKETLHNTITQWRGNTKQIDDMLVLGVKL